MTEQDKVLLAGMAAEMAELQPRIDELVAKDPLLKPWTAMTIAQDERSVRLAHEAINNGKSALSAVSIVGSYSRFQAAVDLLPDSVMWKEIIDLWRGSDPDDTNPEFLKVWERAHQHWKDYPTRHRLQSRYMRDGSPLPGRGQTIVIYRGMDQPPAPFGIAWTTNLSIAEKFATGAATRQMDRPGVVWQALVQRKNIIAYITQRGESEVIVNPDNIWMTDIIQRYERVTKETE